MLLDGHVRLMILKDLGQTSAKCLISTDDEGFTYNHKVKLVEPRTIQRSEGKAKRVIDNRKL